VSRVAGAWLLLAVTGCSHPASPVSPAGPSTAAAPTPPAVAAAPAASGPAPVTSAVAPGRAAASAVADIPTTCAEGRPLCVPPVKFTEAVCHTKYDDLALTLFAKGTPWQRWYVKPQYLEPVNVYEGERSDHWLEFSEEVLVIGVHSAGSRPGVQVSGPTDVDVLRWDGTCATIRQEMFAHAPPTTPTAQLILWKYLDESLQNALLADPSVKKASEKEHTVCKGLSLKHPEGACLKAMKGLTEAIAAAVRGGLALPRPAKLPAWNK